MSDNKWHRRIAKSMQTVAPEGVSGNTLSEGGERHSKPSAGAFLSLTSPTKRRIVKAAFGKQHKTRLVHRQFLEPRTNAFPSAPCCGSFFVLWE